MLNIFLLFVLLLIFALLSTKEYYQPTYDYDYPLSPIKYRDECPVQGLINDMDPNIRNCFDGYYIPSIFNVGTYTSDVQPQS